MRKLLLLLGLPLLMMGCAVIDPHNIVGRVRAPAVTEDSWVLNAEAGWRQAAFNQVWQTIHERYYDPHLNGVDWPAVRTQYETQVIHAANDDVFWRLLDKMAGELRDAHTRVHPPKQVALMRTNVSHSLGLGLVRVTMPSAMLLVSSVHPHSDAWWAGVRPGMGVLQIDGEAALAVFQKQLAETSNSSTPLAQERTAMQRMTAGALGSSVTMVFQRSDGSTFAATMKRRQFDSAASLSWRILPSGFGYLHFSAFTLGLQGRILQALDEMKDAPGLIVDLRNNGGGALVMSETLLGRFFVNNQKGMRTITRDGKPITLLLLDVVKLQAELKGSQASAYTRPMVVLMNENSASAAEVFASTLQDLGRATVIGRRSCGCLLGFLGYADLPGGGQLAYSEIGFISPKGKRIEGEGVVPDVPVAVQPDDYLLQRDRTLEAAVVYLQDVAAPAPKAAGL